MIPDVEICIASDSEQMLSCQLGAVKEGGASRVELCSNMHMDGLSPSVESIRHAAEILGGNIELLVMNRPRGPEFCLAAADIDQMQQFIVSSSEAGAQGTVIGVLDKNQRTFEYSAMKALVDTAKEMRMTVTCHRAFDALDNTTLGLENLKKMNVDRVLTAGSAWGAPVLAHLHTSQFKHYMEVAEGEIEIVIAGGINASNAGVICKALRNPLATPIPTLSLHAYSGAKMSGKVHKDKVSSLVEAVTHTF